jgi:hypothetical protein
MLLSQPFLFRESPDGRREVSWRVWVLIWVAPLLFLAAATLMLGYEGWRHLASVPNQGEVVRVYAWDGETIFDKGSTNYSPVFRYRFSDGSLTEASAGMSHPDWNFDIGSVHAIRTFPHTKRNVVLPGWQNWAAGLIVGGIGAVLLPPALWLTARARRWQRAGA